MTKTVVEPTGSNSQGPGWTTDGRRIAEGDLRDVELVKMDIKDSMTQRRYICARHGEHDATMYVRTYAPPNTSGQRDVQLDRVYCMHCYIEALAKIGVREMDPVVGK